MKTLRLDIVSQEESIYSGDVSQVIAMSESGELGIFPGHTPLIGLLKPGEVRFLTEHHEECLFVSGGVIEVQPGQVTVLADIAVRAKDLDEAEAIVAKEAAEKLMADKKSDIDYARVSMELAEAITKLRLISKWRENQ